MQEELPQLQQFIQFQSDKDFVQKMFNNDEKSLNSEGIQTDTQFVQRILCLKQKTQILEKHIFAERAVLNDKEYQMIQNIGQKHFQCQLANQTCTQNNSQWPQEAKCICGCNKASGKSLSYCASVQTYPFFGPGVMLFFFYSKRIMILVLLTILFYGIYALVTNIVGQQFQWDCVNYPNGIPFLCQWIRIASYPHKQQQYSLKLIQVWLAVLVCFLWVFGIRLIQKIGRIKNVQLDKKLDSSADYCLWLDYLPPGKYSETDLVKYIAKIWRMRKNKNEQNPRIMIKSVQILYQLKQMREIQSKIRKIGMKIFKMYEQDKDNDNSSNQDDDSDRDNSGDNDNGHQKDKNSSRRKNINNKHDQNYQNQQDNQNKQTYNNKNKNKNKVDERKDKQKDKKKDKQKNKQKDKTKDKQKNKQKNKQNKSNQSQQKQREYRVKQEMIEDYKKAKEQLDQLETQFKNYRKKIIQDSAFRQKLTHQTAIIEFIHEQNCEQILWNYGVFQRSHFRDIKHKILSLCKNQQQTLMFHRKQPKIIRAPQPSDIIWANAGKDQNMLRISVMWIINFVTIGASFGSLMLFRYLAEISNIIKETPIISIIILNLFNRFIWNAQNIAINIEQNKTKTQQISSVMNKSYVGQSFNIIVLPLIIHLGLDNNLKGINGLSGAIHDYQLTSFVFSIIFNLVNVPYRITQLIVLIPCLRRIFIKYYCRITNNLNSLEQIRQVLKQLYQPPPLPLNGFYVQIITVINQAFFFCHLQPVILVYLLFNLISFFIVNKFLIMKQCKTPDMLDFFIFQSMVIMSTNVPLFYSVGCTVLLLADNERDIVFYIPNIVIFVIWFMGSQNPFNLFKKMVSCLTKCFFEQKIVNEYRKQFEESSSKINESDRQQKNEKQGQQLKQVKDKKQKDRKHNKKGQKKHNKKGQQKQQHKSQQQQHKSQQQQQEDQEDKVSMLTNQRRQNYYAESPMSDLFNFQHRLINQQGPYHHKLKQFCQMFQFNMPNQRKKVSIKDI